MNRHLGTFVVGFLNHDIEKLHEDKNGHRLLSTIPLCEAVSEDSRKE